MIVLRDYQSQAIERARGMAAGGTRAICLVCPTGGGKTAIGAEIARLAVDRNRRVLWLAHRTELVDQAADALERAGLRVGVTAPTSARRPQIYAPVQVASLATLARRGDRPAADLLVFDECHHAAAGTYASILESYPSAHVIGLTATPERGDGRGLGDAFRGLLVVARVRELVDAGHLVDCDLVAPSTQLRPGQIAQRPVDAYRQHAAGRSAIVFAVSIEHAAKIAAEFRECGLRAQVVDANTGAADRASAIAEFRAGRLPVLVNCMVLTEGFDAPVASACILARGCGTAGLYLQMAGRILRPHPGKGNAVLIDLRGVSHTHGHPCDDRQYSLAGRGIRRDVDGPAVDQSYCRVCGAPVAPGSACEECGTAARVMSPLVVTGEPLVRYARMRSKPAEEQRAIFGRWQAEGAAKGYRPGWARAKAKSVFGVVPV